MKKKIFIVFVLAAAMLAGLPSCKIITVKEGTQYKLGTGPTHIRMSEKLVDWEIPVADFSGIVINFPCDLYFTNGPTSFSAYSPEELKEYLDIRMDGENLKIDVKEDYSFDNLETFDVFVSSPELDNVIVNGAGNFNVKEGLKSDRLRIIVNGAAEIDADRIEAEDLVIIFNGAGSGQLDNLDCGYVSITANGSADCEISGRANEAELSIHGVGSIDATEFKCSNIVKNVVGVGRIYL